MKKLIYLDDRAKKFVISVIVLAFVGVIAMSMLMGCTGEEVDRAKDTTGRIIDIIDNVDEIEKEIEDIIDKEAPCNPDVEVSGAMMADIPPQGGIPPSSPNRIRGIGNGALIMNVSQPPIVPPVIPPTVPPVLPPIIPMTLGHFIATLMSGDYSGIPIIEPHDTTPGCLFENVCWNGCA